MVQLSLLPIPRIVDYVKLVIQPHSGPTTCLWPTRSGIEHIWNLPLEQYLFIERHLETHAYTSTLTSFDLLTLRPPKSTWRHWFRESQTEIDATKTERAAILLGFKPNGSKVSCGSNRIFAVLLRGSPHWQGAWDMMVTRNFLSLTTFTTWPRSGEQRAAGFSSDSYLFF